MQPDMWQRFTERARKVVYFAQEEAGLRGQSFVSTEHLLLGVLREPDSVACRLLEEKNLSLARIREEVEKKAPHAEGKLTQEMQLTPRAKQVIDFAYDEARKLESDHIGTQHLLLGLVREEGGIAGRVLKALGIELEPLRNKVTALRRPQQPGPPRPEPPPAAPPEGPTGKAPSRPLRSLRKEILAIEGKEGESLTEVAARATEVLNARADEDCLIDAITFSSEGGIHRILMVVTNVPFRLDRRDHGD